jgi:hypothetical protein
LTVIEELHRRVILHPVEAWVDITRHFRWLEELYAMITVFWGGETEMSVLHLVMVSRTPLTL